MLSHSVKIKIQGIHNNSKSLFFSCFILITRLIGAEDNFSWDKIGEKMSIILKQVFPAQ